MSNMLRKIRRNNAQRSTGVRDHKLKYKLSMKKAKEDAEKKRKEKEKEDKNLGL